MLLQRIYVFRLRSFLALCNFHRYLLTFMERSSSRTVNGAKMYEYILATFLFYEAESLLVIKPLNCAFYCLCHITLVL